MSEVKVIEKEVLYKGKWVNFCAAKVQGKEGNIYNWEYIARTSNNKGDVDAAIIIPILHTDNGNKIVLIREFRPAVEKKVIELPAGLIDKGETVSQAAVRELKEETGFVGTPRYEGYPVFLNAALVRSGEIFVTVDIDGNAEENKHPQQMVESTESIDVFTVEIEKLGEELIKLEREGYVIDGRLYMFVQGWELGRLFAEARQ